MMRRLALALALLLFGCASVNADSFVFGHPPALNNGVGSQILLPAITAPATPPAGFGIIYEDSTNKVLSFKNDAGTVSSTVVPSTGGANQFATGISAAGVISYATIQPGGSPTQIQYDNGGVFGGVSGSSVSANGSLGLGGATVTATDPVLNLTQTWNNAAVAFDGLKLNITNTASAAASRLLDVQLAGTSKLSVDVNAVTYTGAISEPGASLGGVAGALLFVDAARILYTNSSNFFTFGSTTSGINFDIINSNIDLPGAIGFQSSFSNIGSNIDTQLLRQGVGLLAETNGATPQTFRVYNTTDSNTSPTNYERAIFDWTTTANQLTIGTQNGGTGSPRNIVFVLGSNTPLQLNTSAQVIAQSVFVAPAASNGRFQFSDGSGTGIGWATTNVLNFVGPSNGPTGWFNYGGQARVSSNVTFTSTTTLGTVTGLSVNVLAGRTYHFRAHLSFTDAAAGGIQAAIAGTATATNIVYDGWTVDSAANGVKGNTQATALGTAVASTTTTGTAGFVEIDGTITVNAAGTLLVQAAQNTSNGTATTVKQGSTFLVEDMP